MHFSILPMIILLIVNLLVDYYIYRAMNQRLPGRRWVKPVATLSSAIGVLLLAAILILPTRGRSDSTFLTLQWLMFTFFTLYIPKYLFCIVDLLSHIPQLFRRKRFRPLSWVAMTLAAAAFIAMWWGALVNRFRINVEEVSVAISTLPESFEGFRIAQISDLHLGSYGNDTTFISRLTDVINSQNPDIIVFTGDIVNRHADEIKPFLPVLARFHAPDGEYAILGNHDYADYYFDSQHEREADRVKLRDYYRQTVFQLLNDEYVKIRRGNDSIVLIGVQDIGEPPFPVYGSLSKAYPTPDDNVTKILLSHDPAHWLDSIAGHRDVNIALTLSGHTHSAQMKIGRISPAAIFHNRAWAGLYTDADSTQQLYINIGIGTVGIPMRLGATPQVTLFTLRRRQP